MRLHYYVLTNVSSLAWMAMEGWVFSRDRRKVEGQSSNRGSLLLLIGLIITGIWGAWFAALVLRSCRMNSVAAFGAGIALMWLGMALRLWAILVLGKFFRTTVTMQQEHQLVTAGPYRLLRHPAYSGSLLTMAGMGMALNNWVSLALLLAAGIAGYGYRIQVEERALAQQFGDGFGARWRLIPLIF